MNLPYNQQTTTEEELAFAKLFEEAGFDALCVRLGIKDYHPAQFGSDLYFILNGLEGMSPWGYQYNFDRHFQGLLDGSHQGAGMLLGITKLFKDAVDIPIGTVTYMDPAHAPRLLRGGARGGQGGLLHHDPPAHRRSRIRQQAAGRPAGRDSPLLPLPALPQSAATRPTARWATAA